MHHNNCEYSGCDTDMCIDSYFNVYMRETEDAFSVFFREAEQQLAELNQPNCNYWDKILEDELQSC